MSGYGAALSSRIETFHQQTRKLNLVRKAWAAMAATAATEDTAAMEVTEEVGFLKPSLSEHTLEATTLMTACFDD